MFFWNRKLFFAKLIWDVEKFYYLFKFLKSVLTLYSICEYFKHKEVTNQKLHET